MNVFSQLHIYNAKILLKQYTLKGRYRLKDIHNLLTSAAHIQITKKRTYSWSLEATLASIQPLHMRV